MLAERHPTDLADTRPCQSSSDRLALDSGDLGIAVLVEVGAAAAGALLGRAGRVVLVKQPPPLPDQTVPERQRTATWTDE